MHKYPQLGADCAAYTYALQNNYSGLTVRDPENVRNGRLPKALSSLTDLDFLRAASPFVSTDMVLVSAGQFLGGSTPDYGMFQSPEPGVLVIGDSSGYQVAKGGVPWKGTVTCQDALTWLETYAHVGMTLDIPTFAIDRQHPQFGSFERCLTTTLESLNYFTNCRTKKDLRLLNVLQGRDPSEADQWYSAVSQFPFEGWAIGGSTRLDIAELCRRVVVLVQDERINSREAHLHVLGTSRLSMAVILTALQRAVRAQLKLPSFRITFDSATPSILTQNGKAISGVTMNTKRFNVATAPSPSGNALTGKASPYPFRSQIGDRLTMSDLCVRKDYAKGNAYDELSGIMLTNHNLEGQLAAIRSANAVFDLDKEAAFHAPEALVRAVDVVRDLFRYPDPLAHIRQHRKVLSAVHGSSQSDDEDSPTREEERFA